MQRMFAAIATIAVIVGFASAAQAGVVTNVGSTAPTGLISQTSGTDNLTASRDGGTQPGDNRVPAQTFTSPAFRVSMDAIAVKLNAAHSFSLGRTTTLQMKILDMNLASPPANDGGFPDSDNVILQTVSFNVSGLTGAIGDWLRLDLDTPITLSPDALYAYVLYWSGDETGNNLVMARETSSVYTGGTARFALGYNSANWTSANPLSSVVNQPFDKAFVVLGEPIPTPAALPASLALVGAMAMRRRR